MNHKCVFCEAVIDTAQDFQEVKGYERIRRSGGGTNSLRLREVLDDRACRFCIDKHARAEKLGISPEQGSLL